MTVISRFLKLALAIMSCIVVMNQAQCTTSDPKYKLYLVEGEKLYMTHCSNCHQSDGMGLRKVYPPLASSDFMEQNLERVICGMKYGMKGDITVNDVMYNQPMPGVMSLTELELAEIATYIYNTGDHQRGLIDVKQVATIMHSCERP